MRIFATPCRSRGPSFPWFPFAAAVALVACSTSSPSPPSGGTGGRSGSGGLAMTGGNSGGAVSADGSAGSTANGGSSASAGSTGADSGVAGAGGGSGAAGQPDVADAPGGGRDAAGGAATAGDTATGEAGLPADNPPPALTGTTVTATVKVTPGTPLGKLPAGSAGFSFEKSHMSDGFFTATHAPLIAMLKLLCPGVVRIGADDVNNSVWVPSCLLVKPGTTSPNVGTAEVDALADFLSATGWNCLLYTSDAAD